MPTIYRQYGTKIEITKYEKASQGNRKIRVRSWERDFDYGCRRRDSITRTFQTCVRRVSTAVAEYGCPALFTFTFSGDASDAVRLSQAIRAFLLRLRRKYPDAVAVIVPELSPNRRLHAHGLVFGVPMHFTGFGSGGRVHKGADCSSCSYAELWTEGYVDVRETDGSEKLAYYIAKYLSKAHDEVILRGIRLLRFSKSFPHPIVVKGLLADCIYDKYINIEPVREWETINPVLGRITRKYYQLK